MYRTFTIALLLAVLTTANREENHQNVHRLTPSDPDVASFLQGRLAVSKNGDTVSATAVAPHANLDVVHISSMHGPHEAQLTPLVSAPSHLALHVAKAHAAVGRYWKEETALLNFGLEPHQLLHGPTHAQATTEVASEGFIPDSPLLESDRWALLCMCATMCLALCLNFVDSKKMAIITLMVLWSVSSVAMNIVNKIALKVLPLPMTLLMTQMSIAIVILCVLCGPLALLEEIRVHAQVAVRWSMLTMFFAAGLVTSLMALQTGSVTFVLVVRNAMPLVSLMVERQLLPVESTRPITTEGVFALVTLATGTAIYASFNLKFTGSYMSLFWVSLNMIVMISYRLAERKVLWDMPRSMSFGALNLIQNVAGMLPVIALFFAWGEYRTLLHNPDFFKIEHWYDPMKAVCVAFSGCAGLALGYYSTKLQKEITATTMLALQSCMKVIIIFLAMMVLGEHLGTWSAVGCAVSLLGGIWYAWIASRPAPMQDKGVSSPSKV